MDATVEACRGAALDLLKRARTPSGFVASPSFEHYDSVWTRDAGITSLGAVASGDGELIEGIRQTLETLRDRQTDLGMVPNAYWPATRYWDWGETGSVDAQAWYIIMAGAHQDATGDNAFARSLLPSLERCFLWLRCQDRTGFGLVSSGEANDWMDSTLNRSGIVLHNNVLWYRASLSMDGIRNRLGMTGGESITDLIRTRINQLLWPEPSFDYSALLDHVAYPAPAHFPHPASLNGFSEAAVERSFYLSHVTFGTYADVCDVLANCLAVVFGVAPDDRAQAIVEYLSLAGAAAPFPSKTLIDPVTSADPWNLVKTAAERTQEPRWRNPPGRYHNGAVWPFIGGFHVMALAALGRTAEAEARLHDLAVANRLRAHGGEWGFHEWIDATSAEPQGAPDQAWSAGAYLAAYEAVARH